MVPCATWNTIIINTLPPVRLNSHTFCHDQRVAGAATLARAQNGFFAELVGAAPGRLFALVSVPQSWARSCWSTRWM
jgi:hypothetical protein